MAKLLSRLLDPARSGVYRVPAADAVLDALRASPVRPASVRFAGKEELLRNIAAALEFPAWFGQNWDALEDCLGDLSWRDQPAHVVLFEGARAGDDFGVLVDVLQSAAGFWAERGKPFFALFVDPQRVLPLPELYRER